MQANHYQKQNGSMLLEALVVIVVLSIGITFIIQSLSSSMRALSYSINYSKAALLTEQKLSEILLNKNHLENFNNSGKFDSSFQNYRYTTKTEAVTWPSQETPSAESAKINLDISWQNGSKNHNVSTTLCLLNPSENKNQQ